MDALQQAKTLMESNDLGEFSSEVITSFSQAALAYAAIATAEAAQRQAAALESIADILKNDYITVAKKEW